MVKLLTCIFKTISLSSISYHTTYQAACIQLPFDRYHYGERYHTPERSPQLLYQRLALGPGSLGESVFYITAWEYGCRRWTLEQSLPTGDQDAEGKLSPTSSLNMDDSEVPVSRLRFKVATNVLMFPVWCALGLWHTVSTPSTPSWLEWTCPRRVLLALV